MSGKRAPSPPPQIAGFEYLRLIGSGGFSDVFLYQQRRPRRRVAVKVLLQEWSSPSQREAFDAEADLMAMLSNHPSIVTMYEADVADDGRPYLAMEYCSRPNLASRYRNERFSVAEVLRIAVQVAGAVETAHRAGVLHRDIKPANILVTEYGHPALTDFGISSTLDDAARAEGMSIPWSPPESFAEPPRSGVGTDLWGLAATTYTLLAGRSPFEVPGGSNSSANLMSRIEGAALAPTGRQDVPASLERVLATAMAKTASSRYPTVLMFARSLQQVQNELSLAVTPIDLLDDSGHVQEEEPDDDGGTRLRVPVSIDPTGTSAPPAGTSTGTPSDWSRPVASTAAGASTGYVPGQGAMQYGAGPATTYGAPGGRPPQTAAPAAWQQGATPGGTAPTSAAGPAQHVATADTTGPSRSHPGSPAHRGSWGDAPVEDTVHRAVASEQQQEAEPEGKRRGALWPVLSGVVVLVLAGVGVFALTRDPPSDDPDEPSTAGQTFTPSDNLGGVTPSVNDLAGEWDEDREVATFTWAYDAPDAQDGDSFVWCKLELGEEGCEYQPAFDDTEVELSAKPGDEVCIKVAVERDGRLSNSPRTACVTGGEA
ncbi:protein kinase domain-containing protein [Cellulosimicrobium arenosum]|uniref:non-specific serine/threonine protein kinase n=1 Tax=Cellulosimicrobium arenosum TaxID=2708133 RepID=A0A927J288_9MICO|nr:protein kinase [Cellulosimicrobium arenosum]